MASVMRQGAGRYLQWRFDRWTPERLHRHQQRRLAALVRHLSGHSPYYAGLAQQA